MSIFNTDPSDMDAVNEQMKREAEEREAARREAEQQEIEELAAQSALSKKDTKDDMTSPFQADAESGLKSLFGEK